MNLSTVDLQQMKHHEHDFKLLDDWSWCALIVKQIRRWYAESHLPSEDAFRIMDADFDG